VSEAADEGRAALDATMEARIESEGVGSVTREKAITDALDAIEGVHKVKIAKEAIFVTYDPVKTTKKKIEESIRASGSNVTSATADTEAPSAATATRLSDTEESSRE
jgi:copper chaperone CopZ